MRLTLASAIVGEHPEFRVDSLGGEAWDRLDRLAAASPLYAQLLRQRPELCLWLEEENNRLPPYHYQALVEEWRACSKPEALAPPAPNAEEVHFSHLRRWRRQMSLRIAYRSVNGLADEPCTVGELTRLAEFCLRECVQASQRRWTERLGEPWEDQAGRAARFCVLALGKLGGGELNFSSDIDLVYFYEGDGSCRRNGETTATANVEYFTRVAETVTQLLGAQTADGFLFRADVRLRPEGAWGPLVQSFSGLENYYATAGQTWERLAMLKARGVAGDLALGEELLEDLHSFRYPRRPPPSLLAEVAAMKLRTEHEIGDSAERARDVKRGPGGIREIEFIVQALQLLHAGKYPFLQTPTTSVALDQLARYGLIDPADGKFLGEAYWFLRRVEHALQIREERQTHELPADPAELEAVARTLGFDGSTAFRAALDSRRERIRALYEAFFSDREVDRGFEAWWEFFTTDKAPERVASRLAAWFGPDPAAAPALRLFVCGDRRMQVTRELVTRFQHLASNFDALAPQLARPLETLARLARCAERYGTRQQFLNSCAANSQLLRVLGLLCDRSSYSVDLLCAHPEILEEVLRPEMLRRRKTPQDLAAELSKGSATDPSWLWLYVRAEQMRHLAGELLGFLDLRQAELNLTELADTVLRWLFGRERLLVVALGKYGGRELVFGSDLDVIVVSEEGAAAAASAAAAIETARAFLRTGGPLGATFSLDLRLRPHGDAGPLATTLPALAAYLRQTWEKQALARARIVAGPPVLADAFRAWLDGLLYVKPLTEQEQSEIWSMRRRIELERDVCEPPQRAYKTGAGGLVDCEFLAQTLQLIHGGGHPELRQPGTRELVRALGDAGLLPAADASALIDNFNGLKRIEFALRRESNQPVSVLPASSADRLPLARWLGWPDEPSFWRDYTRRFAQTRQILLYYFPSLNRSTPEGGL